MTVIRRWKRDGSKNYMDMDAAVENIKINCGMKIYRSARKNLMNGLGIETRLALFYLDKHEGRLCGMVTFPWNWSNENGKPTRRVGETVA